MKKGRIITLLTDFGLKDHFVGTMKGVIYSINPDAVITDITHEISPQDIFEGSFNLYQSYKYFPHGTVHMAVVDPGVGGERKCIIIKTDRYTYIGPDNGILSLAVQDECDKPDIYEINNKKYLLENVSNTFHGRDIFAPVSAHISAGIEAGDIGKPVSEYNKIEFPKIEEEGASLSARIIFIDKFGNLITNIDNSYVDRIERIELKDIVINNISASYNQDSPDSVIALPGSTNFLEISIYMSNAAKVLGIKRDDKVSVYLNEK